MQCAHCEALERHIAELEEERNELKDKLLRTLARMGNVRCALRRIAEWKI